MASTACSLSSSSSSSSSSMGVAPPSLSHSPSTPLIIVKKQQGRFTVTEVIDPVSIRPSLPPYASASSSSPCPLISRATEKPMGQIVAPLRLRVPQIALLQGLDSASSWEDPPAPSKAPPEIPLDPLHKVIRKFHKTCTKSFSKVHAAPPSKSEPPCDVGDRMGIFSYSEEISVYAGLHLTPPPPSLAETVSGKFCLASSLLLLKEIARLSDKYREVLLSLTNSYNGILSQTSTASTKERIRLAIQTSQAQLAACLSGKDGLYSDLDRFQTLLQACTPLTARAVSLAPSGSSGEYFLKRCDTEESSDACPRVEFPNVFHPDQPIPVDKARPSWQEECEMMRSFYAIYNEILYKNVHYLEKTIKQFHNLGAQLESLQKSVNKLL